jgi:hypothetical protein
MSALLTPERYREVIAETTEQMRAALATEGGAE